MTIPVRFEFMTNTKLQSEAMIAGTQTLMRGPHRVIWTATGLLFTALMALGGAALTIAVCYNLGVDPGLWMVVGGAISGALYITHQQLMLKSLAKQAAAKPLNTGQQAIDVSEAGITFETDRATWFTPWHLIDGVRLSKSSILLAIGGITFTIPKSQIANADAVAALINDLTSRLTHV